MFNRIAFVAILSMLLFVPRLQAQVPDPYRNLTTSAFTNANPYSRWTGPFPPADLWYVWGCADSAGWKPRFDLPYITNGLPSVYGDDVPQVGAIMSTTYWFTYIVRVIDQDSWIVDWCPNDIGETGPPFWWTESPVTRTSPHTFVITLDGQPTNVYGIFHPPVPLPTPWTVGRADRLLQGRSLLPGQSIESPSDAVKMVMQASGNLIIQVPSSASPTGWLTVWQTGTNKPGAIATLLPSGDFVVTYGGVTLWSAHSNGWASSTFGSMALLLNNDATLSLYNFYNRQVWQGGAWTTGGGAGTDRLLEGQVLVQGKSIIAPNGLAMLQMRATDGNLVKYVRASTASAWQLVWASQTGVHPLARLTIKNGNLMLYASYGGALLWSIGTSGSVGLVIQNNGSAVLYNSWLTPLWTR